MLIENKTESMLDYEVVFSADWDDVRFGDTKQGGILSVRVASSMDVVQSGCIENAHGGIFEKEIWGKRAAWCDYSDPVDDRWQGITHWIIYLIDGLLNSNYRHLDCLL